jgi:uncharacterized protein YebE (UPF0316 family)
MKLLLYFIIGAVLDILATIDVIAVQDRSALLSSTVSFVLTMVSYAVFWKIMESPDRWSQLIVYALGGSVGAYLVIVYF